MCLTTISLVSLSGCSQNPQSVSVDVSCDDFSKSSTKHIEKKEVKVTPGNTVVVTLCSNPTTGFKWELGKITDKDVLENVDNKYISPEETGLVAASGKEVWTFKALKKGESTVSLEYSRSWEGGEKAEWKFSVTVVVD